LSSRLLRLLRDHSYRAHVRNEAKLFARYPRAVGYKSAAMVLNRGHRLGRRLNDTAKENCRVCGWKGNAFDAIATLGYLRRNARCPGCGSLERHRAMIEFLEREGWVSNGASCLDIGGIPPFRSWFETQGVRYVSLSLGDPAMVCMNIQQMGFADDWFDLVLDSHVLEYVNDYRQALSEMWRVLRPGGKMLLTESYLFGQPDTEEFGGPEPAATFMVRRFGDDLLGLLEESGFQTRRWDYTGRNDCHGDYFFLCEKTSSVRSREKVA
jgi:SAM-dependent methyltransferase